MRGQKSEVGSQNLQDRRVEASAAQREVVEGDVEKSAFLPI